MFHLNARVCVLWSGDARKKSMPVTTLTPNPPIPHGSNRLTSASATPSTTPSRREIHQQHNTEQQAQADEMEDLAVSARPRVIQHEPRSRDRGIRPGGRVGDCALRDDLRMWNLAADRRGAREEDEADRDSSMIAGRCQRRPRHNASHATSPVISIATSASSAALR